MEQEKKSALIISNIKKCLHGMEGLQLKLTNVITLRWTPLGQKLTACD